VRDRHAGMYRSVGWSRTGCAPTVDPQLRLRLLALGSWLLALGSWLLALGSWLLALRGPRMTRRVGGGKPAGWPAGMRASFSPGQDALSKNPGTHPRTWRAAGPQGASSGGALLFGYFLLGKQEKVTRAAAAARKPAAGEPGRDNATTVRTVTGFLLSQE